MNLSGAPISSLLTFGANARVRKRHQCCSSGNNGKHAPQSVCEHKLQHLRTRAIFAKPQMPQGLSLYAYHVWLRYWGQKSFFMQYP